MTKLYRHPLSGHSHRAELFLSLIGKEAELVDVDLLSGAHKADDFLKRNAFGQVPVLEDEGNVISDSNGILVYLAAKHGDEKWYPRDPKAAAEVQLWLSKAAGEIKSGPANARLVTVFGAGLDHEQAKTVAYGLFDVMERHLGGRDFLVGSNATIADVAAYSYVAHAPEGEVSLEPYPNIRAWLNRIEALEGFVPMQQTKVGLAA